MKLDEPVATDPLLTVKDLEVGFESFDGFAEVIDGVNLSIGKGEVVTIAGETGCGKSVTMKSILRLLNQPPARVNGEITFDGTELLSLSDSEFERVKGQRMSLVFQDPMSSLNPTFTIGEQLTDTAQFGGDSDTGVIEFFRRKFSSERDEARERVLEMLREVQMPDPENIMDSYPSQLSGGMRQRALIAQALLNEPDLLIADEIGTALDVTIHDQILDLLKDLIEEHDLSVLMITHNLGVARQVSDRVYVMYGGRIVETAPTEELFENPKHPYTQGLIASIPRLTGDEMAEGIDGSIPEYLDPPRGCRFAPRCPYATAECEQGRPEMYQGTNQSGVECILYDETVELSDRPTVEETRSHMTRRSGSLMGDD
ncbi:MULTISPECIES: ABC transporter ATP-binding protein [Haloferax]|uniref:ATP-binding cassette domain-containing protein n=1 Tax=Haloferax marinum TaxID=2666143 RepID=A0A6A8G7T5_9EURY|nr:MULTISPECIES: ABC transporter ATP-binding protein [Haloferax]KAB1197863.1 ABC transporter ATP-binding protein [Haloferax sp. CBA1150]MRW96927.1 ATP-binding cassette domain-containing protein [Haloferax marinum]